MTDAPHPHGFDPVPGEKMADIRYRAAKIRRDEILQRVQNGEGISEARTTVGMSPAAYRQARAQHATWAAHLDAAAHTSKTMPKYNKGAAEFFLEEFGHSLAWFHILYLNELMTLPKGNILVAIFPPESGKTSLFEDYANMKLALDPNHKFIVAGANQTLAKKIIGRVRDRMELNGPTPGYSRRWGPFAPQFGIGRQVTQPWGMLNFNVYKKALSDERDFSMEAVGVGSEIIGTRPSHLHLDDPQSTRTIGKDGTRTEELDHWFRQDVISRPGETGVLTVAGTIVGEDGWIQTLEDDAMVDAGIMKVLKFPAIGPYGPDGEMEPLWKERYTMDQMERIKIKSGSTVWDSQYMMNPGASSKHNTTFAGVVDPCKNPFMSLTEPPPNGAICYITLDPALGSKNCVMVLQPAPGQKLIVRRIQERTGLRQNEEIINELREALVWATSRGARVSDIVIEAMNFQRGLSRDDRLVALARSFGAQLREHMTGSNKVDPNIGIPSMASSFIRNEIVLPYAPDDFTRERIDELVRQLHAWKKFARGSKLRQDQVMALWFGWLLWTSRWKVETRGGDNLDQWNRVGLDSGLAAITRLALPQGVR